MYTKQEKSNKNKGRSVANATGLLQRNAHTFHFENNRPKNIAQKKLEEIRDNSPQTSCMKQMQSTIDAFSARRQPIQKKAQPVAGGVNLGGGEWWNDPPNGVSGGVAPNFAGGGLTTVWEGPHAGGNHLYATKSAAFHGAFNNLGIQDQRALNGRWTLKQGADRLTMYPDAANNETRVIANHTRDNTEWLDRVQGHHGAESARTGWTQIDHYHAGNYAGQVLTRGMAPVGGWVHVVMPHFYVRP